MENKQFNEINFVPVQLSELYPNRLNPRQNLGDLSELTDSIRANGVLQPLLVIRGHELDDGSTTDSGYTIIIGHRRAAASKAAGLTEVPCVIKDAMTIEQQISTMAVENVLREGLTPYEQGQAMNQLVMAGMSVEEVSKMSGFSTKTVRNRMKIAELDEEGVKEACNRGATMGDFLALYELENEKTRNKVLQTIGTNNFANELAKAKANEEAARWKVELRSAVGAFAEKLDEDKCPDGCCRVKSYWFGYTVTVPEDVGSRKYYWGEDRYSITLYGEMIEQIEPEKSAKQIATEAWTGKKMAVKAEMQNLFDRLYQLRVDHITSLGSLRRYEATITAEAAALLINGGSLYYGENSIKEKLLGITSDSEEKAVWTEIARDPMRALLAVVADTKILRRIARFRWDSAVHADIPSLNAAELYEEENEFLEELGYELSDEEIALINGSHPLYAKCDELVAEIRQICGVDTAEETEEETGVESVEEEPTEEEQEE